MKQKLASKIIHKVILAIFVVLLGFPFFWMAIATFKQDADLYATQNNPFLFNLAPTLDHLRYLFGQTDYLRWLGNTALVGVLVVGITLLLSIPAAYALARLTGRWGERLGIGIFLTYLVPPTLLFIPLSRVVAVLTARYDLGAGPDLSQRHHSVFHLAADGFLQIYSPRTRRRSHGGRPHPLWSFRQTGGPHFALRHSHRGDFHLHAGDPGICLCRDIYFAKVEADGRRGCA